MKSSSKPFLFLLLFLFFVHDSRADNIVMLWSIKDVEGITNKAIEAAKQLSVEEIEKKNLSVDLWSDNFLLMVGANQHQGDKVLLDALAAQLTNKKKSDLKGTSRLIIWERITTGEILFLGRGYQVDEDLFTVAGRANWMLKNLTRKNFGYVKPSTSEEDLTKLQQRWSRWLKGEQVEEQQDEYASTQRSVAELRRGINSPEALEGLITSLKPHKDKWKIKQECVDALRSVYPPNMPLSTFDENCHPDLPSQLLLGLITGVKARHNYDWWKRWWDTNRTQLIWNREKGMFEVKK